MFRASRRNNDAFCNIARGLGRVAAAMAPASVSSVFEFAASSYPPGATPTASDGSTSTTFTTQYDDGLSLAAAPGHQNTTASPVGGFEANALPASVVSELVSKSNTYQAGSETIRYKAVPATQVTRAAGFGSLFVQLAWEKVTGGTPEGALLSPAGHQRIVDTLCRMRGAVLKLGQMLSIQDSNTVPLHVTALFTKVRDQAFAMPSDQLRRTLTAEFGGDASWRSRLFSQLSETPIAAASIGQVHRGTLKAGTVPTESKDDTAFSTFNVAPGVTASAEPLEVAVKVQYPGVAKSIDSDVANLKVLMSLNILPPGMFVDSILRELRNELSMECRYTLEGEKQARYKALVAADPRLREAFHVPRVYKSLSTEQVLVTEFVRGVPIDQLATRADIPQAFRNYISDSMMRLTLSELFRWRFMQTDPNYANFLYDASQRKVNLLDFGAARDYEPAFVRDYLEVVAAAACGDRETIIERSISLGFLTGREVKEMLDAHVNSVLVLGEPFRDRDKPFDFAAVNLPQKLKDEVPVMVKLRLRPPPTPVYSLHRRLSGTILLATKFGATIPSGATFWEIYDEVKDSF